MLLVKNGITMTLYLIQLAITQFFNYNKRTSHNKNKLIEIQTADRSTRAGPSTTGEALLCFTPALEKWDNSELLY